MKTLEQLRDELIEKYNKCQQQLLALQGAVEAMQLAIEERDAPVVEAETTEETTTNE